MKILVLMKRFSANKDQVLESFGREIRLSSELQKKGHEITILCGDQVKKERGKTSLNGMRIEIYPFGAASFMSFLSAAKRMAAENDVVLATSHPLLGLVGALAGKKQVVYDIRDNYETYDLTNIPLLKKGLPAAIVNNYAIRKASLNVCVSYSLKEKVSAISRKPAVVVENGVETELFKPLSKASCRKKLGIPQGVPVITYIGHISKERGADKLIEAFELVRLKHPDCILLLSGPVDRNIMIDRKGIIYRKLAIRKEVPLGINSADVAVIPQPENEMSKYGFPYKLMEYLACNVRVVATAVGDVRNIMKAYPESLCEPGSVQDLAQKIMDALPKKRKANYSQIVKQYSWERMANKLNSEILKLA
jgi:teichuronic acid biosynthesis glycosyltransferase TuaC